MLAAGIPMEQIDVTRDFIDLRFVLRNDFINITDIKYNVFIEEWTEDNFKLKVNFSDPYLISQGEERDVAYVSIKNPGLFVSAKTGVPFDPKL